MGWPQSQDYNEAIQNPQSAFGDSELRGGQAVTNALGIPMPRSGNFADVYEFHGAGDQKWAVKCFTRQIPGLQERYREISKHLVQAKLPFTVDFSYLAKGIRIRGEFYPILKMQWVEGCLLNEFVRDNLAKPALLDALGQIWVRMARRLGEAGIAHADLQHGNVILVPGSKTSSLAVKLIDYDGMFVPSLAQKKSGEVGHPAYQHPQRLQEGIYSADVDRLPLLAIACALRCLAVGGKTLWDKYDNGDNLLFREVDLRNPAASALFKDLWKMNDPPGHHLTGYLFTALGGALGQVPLLQDLFKGDCLRPLSALEEKQIVGLLGGGAVVNSSPSVATAIQVVTPSSPSAPLAGSSLSDWQFDNERSSPRSARKSAPRISNKVWLGLAAVLGLCAAAAVGFWVMQKGEPAKLPEVALAKKENKEPDRPAVKADLAPGKKETKEPDRLVEKFDTVPAKKENKEPDQGTVESTKTKNEPAPVEPDGVLVVQVNEPDSDVYVDGEKVPVAWAKGGKNADIRIKPGLRKVEVKKDGFTGDGAQLTLREGQRQVFTAKLLRVQATPALVSSISPSSGPASGGAVVQVSGRGFQAGSQVFFGSVVAKLSATSTATILTAVTPALTVGKADIKVVNPDGQQSVLVGAFTALASDPTKIKPLVPSCISPILQSLVRSGEHSAKTAKPMMAATSLSTA